jgi:hypothetical protein
MKLPGRISLFILPIGLAAICKATIASAAGGEELLLYQNHPAKLVDLSIDLLLTATSILLGVLLYVQSGATTVTPGGAPIRTSDLVICSAVQIVGLVLIFGSTVGLPHVPIVEQNYEQAATIWIPDAIGLVAFGWVITKLT